MARPNSPDMPPECTQKVRLGIKTTAVKMTGNSNFESDLRTAAIGDYLELMNKDNDMSGRCVQMHYSGTRETLRMIFNQVQHSNKA